MRTLVLFVAISFFSFAQPTSLSHEQLVTYGVKNLTLKNVSDSLIECISDGYTSNNDELLATLKQRIDVLRDVFASREFEKRITKVKYGKDWFKAKKALIKEFSEDLDKRIEDLSRGKIPKKALKL